MSTILVCGSGKLDKNNIIDIMLKDNLTIEVKDSELEISKLNCISNDLEYL